MAAILLVGGLILIFAGLVFGMDSYDKTRGELSVILGMIIILLALMLSTETQNTTVDNYSDCVNKLKDETAENRILLCEGYRGE